MRENSHEHLESQEMNLVSEPKRTSRSRVKLVKTPASFASGAMPPTCTTSYPGMSSPTAAEGDKRRLDGHQ